MSTRQRRFEVTQHPLAFCTQPGSINPHGVAASRLKHLAIGRQARTALKCQGTGLFCSTRTECSCFGVTASNRTALVMEGNQNLAVLLRATSRLAVGQCHGIGFALASLAVGCADDVGRTIHCNGTPTGNPERANVRNFAPRTRDWCAARNPGRIHRVIARWTCAAIGPCRIRIDEASEAEHPDPVHSLTHSISCQPDNIGLK